DIATLKRLNRLLDAVLRDRRLPPAATMTGPRGSVCARPLPALGQVEVGDGSLEGLGGQADGLGQRRVGVDRERDVGGVGAHLDGQRRFADELAGEGADHTAADDPTAALVEEELRQALVTAD